MADDMAVGGGAPPPMPSAPEPSGGGGALGSGGAGESAAPRGGLESGAGPSVDRSPAAITPEKLTTGFEGGGATPERIAAARDPGDSFQAGRTAAEAGQRPGSTTPREEVKVEPRLFGVDRPGYRVLEDAGQVERRTDGLIQGEGGRLFKPEKGKGIDGIPATRPTERPERADGKDPILSFYGIRTNAADAAQQNQALANVRGRDVISVRNATGGLVRDVAESGGQKALGDQTPPVRTGTDILTDRLLQNRPTEIHAHSQGAIIASQSIRDARAALIRDHGFTPAQADERLKLLDVRTYGGASQRYVDGPKYTHNMNYLDYVAGPFGLNNTKMNWYNNPGAGATINRALRFEDPHSFMNYLKWAPQP